MDENLQKRQDLWTCLTELLPQKPKETDGDIWTDGDMLFAPTEEAANTIANLLEGVGFEPVTGHYDPKEDAAAGTVDSLTGYWYIDV